MRYARSTAPASALAFALLSCHAATAFALQPLGTFIEGARRSNATNLEAAATLDLQDATATATLGKQLPSVSFRGSYTRNQYFVEIGPPVIPEVAVITPINQLDGTITVTVPLIDLASFVRIAAARVSSRSAAQQLRATQLQIEASVTQNYYQLVANVALVEASQRALEVAKTSLSITQERFGAGSAASFDVDRASAETERQVQQLTAAQLQVALVARALESATRVAADLSSALHLGDDLHGEPPQDANAPVDQDLPALWAVIETNDALHKQAAAARLALVPTLSGTFTERITNAAGFTGHDKYYAAAVLLNWNLDVTAFANIGVADATLAAGLAREERSRLDVRDTIYRSFKTVESNIVRSRSARAQEKVSQEAAVLAQDRYAAGTTAQLDLLQAQRDAFTAEVTRIEADADLVNSRAQLRFAMGINFAAFAAAGTSREAP